MNHFFSFFTHAVNIWVPINWQRRPCSFHYSSLPSQDINLKLLGTRKPFVMLSAKKSTFWSVKRLGFKLSVNQFSDITELWRTQPERRPRAKPCGWSLWRQSNMLGFTMTVKWRHTGASQTSRPGAREEALTFPSVQQILAESRYMSAPCWWGLGHGQQPMVSVLNGLVVHQGHGNQHWPYLWGKVAEIAWGNLAQHPKGEIVGAEVPASVCPDDKCERISWGAQRRPLIRSF